MISLAHRSQRAASGNVEHDHILFAHLAFAHSRCKGVYGTGRSREDVVSFQIAELQYPVDDVVVAREESVSLGIGLYF